MTTPADDGAAVGEDFATEFAEDWKDDSAALCAEDIPEDVIRPTDDCCEETGALLAGAEDSTTEDSPLLFAEDSTTPAVETAAVTEDLMAEFAEDWKDDSAAL